MTRSRIYAVTDTTAPNDPPRLVRAISQSHAIKHVTRPFKAAVATQDEIVAAITEYSVRVENAFAAEGPQS